MLKFNVMGKRLTPATVFRAWNLPADPAQWTEEQMMTLLGLIAIGEMAAFPAQVSAVRLMLEYRRDTPLATKLTLDEKFQLLREILSAADITETCKRFGPEERAQIIKILEAVKGM